MKKKYIFANGFIYADENIQKLALTNRPINTIQHMKIELKGHLDTSRVADVKNDIDAKLALADNNEHIVIDCRELDYISSSGLRIMLAIKKSHPDMEVVNVNAEVYNVFEMTGFTRILDVKKALRKIDLEKCTRLAHGANGEVYKINDEEIVKLSLFAHREDELIEEMNIAREGFVLGVPTAISFDQVEVSDGRKGIVMEALNSTTLAQHLKDHPEDLDSYIEPYVNLFRTTNAIVVEPGKFRSTKQKMLNCLNSPLNFIGEERTRKVRELVEALPDGQTLVHADGHPCNALLCGDDSSRNLILIDMGDLSIGHPIFEIIGWSFLMNGTDYSGARRIGPFVLGLDYDFLQTMFRKMMASYLCISDNETLNRVIQAAAYVSVLRFICMDQVRNVPKERQPQRTEMVDCTIEHTKELLDGIALLTEVIDKRGA